MAQYKQTEITNVYWASNEGFKGGRDPLGIQNSSIATYSKLLPGLTNLTSHIRYYSLYCWLLSEYDELEKAKKTTLHQYNFIRRAELAMALIMKDQGVGAVVGALFVSQGRYQFKEDGVYDIANGADYESNDKYWTFRSGALGQYYLGSLVYYELIKVEEERFYLRNKGKDLADAVRHTVDERICRIYIECILNGSLAEKSIEYLQPLALHRIVVDSEEWYRLNELLTKSDKDSSLRRETIWLLLNDMSKGVDVNSFVKSSFMHMDKDCCIQASFGWYFYYLCEGLHYSIDSFFSLILHKIYELHNPTMELLIQNIIESLLPAIEIENNYASLDDLRKDVDKGIDIIYDDLRNAVGLKDYNLAATYAIKLLLRIYTEFERNVNRIEEFENQHDLKRQRGILSEGVLFYVKRYLSCSIPEFIKTLIVQIMQEHTVIAIAKMGKSNSDLRKFILEDGRVVLIEQRYPIETSPRVKSLFNFLQDMGYFDNENRLTEVAKKFIENYGKE